LWATTPSLAEDGKRPTRPVSVLRMDADVRAYVPDNAHQLDTSISAFEATRKLFNAS
jgi:hypothetical protein